MASGRVSRWLGLVVVVLILAPQGCRSGQHQAGTQHVRIAGRDFFLELALTPEERLRGLSDRADIPEDGGMLFVSPYPQRLQFVMRRCLVPIDLIYLGPGGRVVSTHAMAVEPYDTPERRLRRYPSVWPAQFAIELRSGSLAALKLKPGDAVRLPVKRLKQLAR